MACKVLMRWRMVGVARFRVQHHETLVDPEGGPGSLFLGQDAGHAAVASMASYFSAGYRPVPPRRFDPAATGISQPGPRVEEEGASRLVLSRDRTSSAGAWPHPAALEEVG